MISRIPALELLRELCGSYADVGAGVSLRIWPCGYGAAIDLTSKDRTILCGVAGAFGQQIECFVQIGLPNVTRTIGTMISEMELRLVGEEPPIEFRFTRTSGRIDVAILFDGQPKAAYALHAA